MASVITTGSTMEQYKKPINEIIYSKQQAQQGQQQNNTGLQNWAEQNAQQYYNMLPAELANQLRAMDVSQARNFYNSLTGGATTAQGAVGGAVGGLAGIIPGIQNNPAPVNNGLTPPTNPFDQQLADLYKQMQGQMQNPRTNPWDAQLQVLISQLQNLMNQGPVNPETTPEFAAAQARIGREMADAGRMAQESLGASGFARSTNLTDRIQQIGEQGADYLETQVLPAISQQYAQLQQAKIQNQMGLLGVMGDQQQVFDQRINREMEQLAMLYEALTGQQQTFDTRAQNQIDNRFKQGQLDIQKGQLDLEGQKFQYQQRWDAIQQENTRIDQALQRTLALGAVSQADSAVLGVPAGTPSFEAQNAAAQRKHQLEMQTREINASMAELNKRIAADKAMNNARIAADKSATSVNALLAIWEASGTAPPGLEQYGIEAGRKWTPSAGQQLQQLELDQKLSQMDENTKINTMVPGLQSQYGVSSLTAQAAAKLLLDSPTYESAMADIEADKVELRQMGVNLDQLRMIIGQRMGPKGGTTKKEPKNLFEAVGDLFQSSSYEGTFFDRGGNSSDTITKGPFGGPAPIINFAP